MSHVEKSPAAGIKGWPSWAGYAALMWSVLYGALHLYWLFGGEGYPFKYNEQAGLFSAIVTYLPAKAGGIVFVILCMLGANISLVMRYPDRFSLPRWLILAYAWGFAAGLIIFVPDISLIMVMAYAFLLKFDFNWLMFNQIVCILGALLWGFAVLGYQRWARGACVYCGREARSEPFVLVKWSRAITWIAAAAPLPYAISRFVWAFDPKIIHEFLQENPSAQVTALVFGIICVIGGMLTLGLNQKWGEVFPAWFPFIGGKRVPILLAVIPASMVAIAVTAAGFVFTFAFTVVKLGYLHVDNIIFNQINTAVGPMLLWIPWGVALGLAAIAYYYRRRGQCGHCGRK
nr:hypothetical protein [Paenibacillus caui]